MAAAVCRPDLGPAQCCDSVLDPDQNPEHEICPLFAHPRHFLLASEAEGEDTAQLRDLRADKVTSAGSADTRAL